MKPEIEAYLRENGARYTTKALRQQLLRAGYEAPEVDSALEETESARAPQLAATKALRSQFWALVWLINFVVLIAVSAVVSDNNPYAGATFLVLGAAMLIGLGISGSIGSAFLAGRGLLVALIVPVLAALILGGSCFAMMGGVGVTVPPTTVTAGTMTLTIKPPLAFDGSGAAQCLDVGNGPQVDSVHLGLLDGKAVHVSMVGAGLHEHDGANSPGPRLAAYVEIQVVSEETGFGGIYFSEPEDPSISRPEDPALQLQTAADGSSTLTFERLRKASESDPNFGPDTISGTISWTC